jgi:hypothetical protein
MITGRILKSGYHLWPRRYQSRPDSTPVRDKIEIISWGLKICGEWRRVCPIIRKQKMAERISIAYNMK